MAGWKVLLVAVYLLCLHTAFGLRGALIRSGRSSAQIFLRDGLLVEKKQFEDGNFHPYMLEKRSIDEDPTADNSQTCSCRFPNGKAIVIVDQSGRNMLEPMRFG